jgi:hypothetical protein
MKTVSVRAVARKAATVAIVVGVAVGRTSAVIASIPGPRRRDGVVIAA